MKSNTQKFFIDGPAGKLEAVLAEPDRAPCGIAVIAHPHPLFGGTMDNKIIYTLFNTLLELGFISVRFNFRGVGESAGVHDDGIGEIEDVVAIVSNVSERFHTQHGSQPLLLAGFSFGGAIQAHAAQRLKPRHLILVAPSVARLSAPPVTDHVDHVLIIHGDQDETVPLQSVLDWAAHQQSQPVVVIPGAEHFFHGRLSSIKDAVLDAFKG